MNNSDIWEDLKFFVDTLKILPVSESLNLSESGSYCVSTNTDFENWVYCPEREITPETASEAARFFREREEAFMWPVYDGGREILEGAGLVYAGDLTAMYFDPAKMALGRENEAVRIEQVLLREEAGIWAETASQGFGEDSAPEKYRRFVEALSTERERVGLYLAKYEGEYAGTFLVTDEPEMMGVYYFAVRPEFRRKGIARAMMSGICRLSGGKRIVLQSTPMGRKFYGAFGFEELFRIPVYSTESDIF